MTGQVVQVNVSPGGVPKTPVGSAEFRPSGIAGDNHRNKRYHGGPRQAVLLISSELVDVLREEGWPLFYGALGENVTTAGLDHRAWRAGQCFRIGAAIIQLTKPRAPCATLNVYGTGIQTRIYDSAVKQLDPRSIHWGESGSYASVLQPGQVCMGDIIDLIDSVV
jgi:MOSC domain-containing protein YiiM